MHHTVLLRQIEAGINELVIDEIEQFAALRLEDFIHREAGVRDDGYTSEEVEQIPIVDSSECTHFGRISIEIVVADEVAMFCEVIYRTVTECDGLIEVGPGVV